MQLSAILVLCALAACGPDYQVPDPVDNDSSVSGGSQGSGDNNGNNDGGGDNTGGGTGGQQTTPGLLAADGDDAGTYSLITGCGYNYETPDNSGEHASAPFRHIRQRYDDVLKKNVFDFYIHIQNDDDRGLASVKDRQRNEIKTDAKSPKTMVAQEGETLRMTWKFRLPAGMLTTTSFCHIHQLKGIDNSAGNADVGHPMITYTCRSTSEGKQQFQVIYVGRTLEDGTVPGNDYFGKYDLADFLGQWVSVSETVTFSKNGSYHLVIYRVSDGKQLVKIDKTGVDLWRNGTTGLRPKWGIYRSFGNNRSLASQLRDEVLGFADFQIEKL